MVATLRQLGFSRYFKRNSSGLFVQGKGALRLSSADFKAQGGEGAIFVKGSMAYKIYRDPKKTISNAKLQELSVLTEPNIIRPLDLLVDKNNLTIGYSMRSIAKSLALCQLFPKAFRLRNNLTPDMTLRLVRKLQDGVKHVHSKGILIVDLNELNFLVAEDFSELYFIDVDSYQTPSFPATVLMESVRDRQAQVFTTGSDWFSFAVVSFQMFVGIHPYKGTYNSTDKSRQMNLDERMRSNVSVLHQGVSVPASCLPFSVIPAVYLDWYRAVFETGERVAPPDNLVAQLNVGRFPIEDQINRKIVSSTFEITELREFDGDILWHNGPITVTSKNIYFNGRQYSKPNFDVRVVVTPKQQHLIVAFMDGLKPRFVDLSANVELGPAIEGESLMMSEGRLYVKQGENLVAVEFLELNNKVLLTLRVVASVMMRSTSLFDGLAIQNLLGASYVAIPRPEGVCHQLRLVELEDYQVVDARLFKTVLIVVAAGSGVYDKLIFRFSDDFSSYDVRVISNVETIDIDFTVLDSGVVLNRSDGGALEVFYRARSSAAINLIDDSAIHGDLRLFHLGTQALMARENKLFKFKMAQSLT